MTIQEEAWATTCKEWYDRLDAFIKAEEADKSSKDPAQWAAMVNRDYITPIRAFFADRFGTSLPIKIEDLTLKKGLFGKGPSKDDLLAKVKALRYGMYEYQKKSYLENAGQL